MIDREKVIEGLTCHYKVSCEIDAVTKTMCPYMESEHCLSRVLGDAIELLSKPGHWVREHDRVRHWHCSECGHMIGVADLMDNYCPNCGSKMMKWTTSRLMAELGEPTYETDRRRRPAQGV